MPSDRSPKWWRARTGLEYRSDEFEIHRQTASSTDSFIFSGPSKTSPRLTPPYLIDQIMSYQQESMDSTDKQRFVGFQAVLRLRPHQKKERDDPVLIEPIQTTPNAVVLHPPQSNLISPSSTLVRQTLSPEAVKSTVDADYRFDSVFWPETDQDRLYFAHGHPMALSAMEPLKDTELKPKNHLIVTMGASGSGKTYTSWGGSCVTARKQDSDGLLPCLLDSLFRQSKHHVFPVNSNKKKIVFAVNLTLLQVRQSQTKPQECQIHDLMQTELLPLAIQLLLSVCSG